jgi:hypothetical protein
LFGFSNIGRESGDKVLKFFFLLFGFFVGLGSLSNFKGNLLLSSHDHEMLQTVCNRIIELTPKGIIDREMSYDEYLDDKKIKELQQQMYS